MYAQPCSRVEEGRSKKKKGGGYTLECRRICCEQKLVHASCAHTSSENVFICRLKVGLRYTTQLSKVAVKICMISNVSYVLRGPKRFRDKKIEFEEGSTH
jgi:hypothetical protein